jgi:hypothetical protein
VLITGNYGQKIKLKKWIMEMMEMIIRSSLLMDFALFPKMQCSKTGLRLDSGRYKDNACVPAQSSPRYDALRFVATFPRHGESSLEPRSMTI